MEPMCYFIFIFFASLGVAKMFFWSESWSIFADGLDAMLLPCLVCTQSLLPQEEAVIFVVSTTGQGDTPDSMKVTN